MMQHHRRRSSSASHQGVLHLHERRGSTASLSRRQQSHETQRQHRRRSSIAGSHAATVADENRRHRRGSSSLSVDFVLASAADQDKEDDALVAHATTRSSAQTLLSKFHPLARAARAGDAKALTQLLGNVRTLPARLKLLNRADATGNTALFHAASLGHADAVRVLLENGSDVHHRNNELNTALHLATERGHRAVVRVLMWYGAKAASLNCMHQTPLDLFSARQQGRNESAATRAFATFIGMQLAQRTDSVAQNAEHLTADAARLFVAAVDAFQFKVNKVLWERAGCWHRNHRLPFSTRQKRRRRRRVSRGGHIGGETTTMQDVEEESCADDDGGKLDDGQPLPHQWGDVLVHPVNEDLALKYLSCQTAIIDVHDQRRGGGPVNSGGDGSDSAPSSQYIDRFMNALTTLDELVQFFAQPVRPPVVTATKTGTPFWIHELNDEQSVVRAYASLQKKIVGTPIDAMSTAALAVERPTSTRLLNKKTGNHNSVSSASLARRDDTAGLGKDAGQPALPVGGLSKLILFLADHWRVFPWRRIVIRHLVYFASQRRNARVLAMRFSRQMKLGVDRVSLVEESSRKPLLVHLSDAIAGGIEQMERNREHGSGEERSWDDMLNTSVGLGQSSKPNLLNHTYDDARTASRRKYVRRSVAENIQKRAKAINERQAFEEATSAILSRDESSEINDASVVLLLVGHVIRTLVLSCEGSSVEQTRSFLRFARSFVPPVLRLARWCMMHRGDEVASNVFFFLKQAARVDCDAALASHALVYTSALAKPAIKCHLTQKSAVEHSDGNCDRERGTSGLVCTNTTLKLRKERRHRASIIVHARESAQELSVDPWAPLVPSAFSLSDEFPEQMHTVCDCSVDFILQLVMRSAVSSSKHRDVLAVPSVLNKRGLQLIEGGIVDRLMALLDWACARKRPLASLLECIAHMAGVGAVHDLCLQSSHWKVFMDILATTMKIDEASCTLFILGAFVQSPLWRAKVMDGSCYGIPFIFLVLKWARVSILLGSHCTEQERPQITLLLYRCVAIFGVLPTKVTLSHGAVVADLCLGLLSHPWAAIAQLALTILLLMTRTPASRIAYDASLECKHGGNAEERYFLSATVDHLVSASALWKRGRGNWLGLRSVPWSWPNLNSVVAACETHLRCTHGSDATTDRLCATLARQCIFNLCFDERARRVIGKYDNFAVNGVSEILVRVNSGRMGLRPMPYLEDYDVTNARALPCALPVWRLQESRLRRCALSSCHKIEKRIGAFLVCPFCLFSAYCSDAHRRQAWQAWHARKCLRGPEMEPKKCLGIDGSGSAHASQLTVRGKESGASIRAFLLDSLMERHVRRESRVSVALHTANRLRRSPLLPIAY